MAKAVIITDKDYRDLQDKISSLQSRLAYQKQPIDCRSDIDDLEFILGTILNAGVDVYYH